MEKDAADEYARNQANNDKDSPLQSDNGLDCITIKPGTIPNPTARPYSRPSSAASRPGSAISNRNRSKGIASNRGAGDPSAAFANRLNQTTTAEYQDLRPNSRIGYNVENLDSVEGNTANPGVLKVTIKVTSLTSTVWFEHLQ